MNCTRTKVYLLVVILSSVQVFSQQIGPANTSEGDSSNGAPAVDKLPQNSAATSPPTETPPGSSSPTSAVTNGNSTVEPRTSPSASSPAGVCKHSGETEFQVTVLGITVALLLLIIICGSCMAAKKMAWGRMGIARCSDHLKEKGNDKAEVQSVTDTSLHNSIWTPNFHFRFGRFTQRRDSEHIYEKPGFCRSVVIGHDQTYVPPPLPEAQPLPEESLTDITTSQFPQIIPSLSQRQNHNAKETSNKSTDTSHLGEIDDSEKTHSFPNIWAEVPLTPTKCLGFFKEEGVDHYDTLPYRLAPKPVQSKQPKPSHETHENSEADLVNGSLQRASKSEKSKISEGNQDPQSDLQINKRKGMDLSNLKYSSFTTDVHDPESTSNSTIDFEEELAQLADMNNIEQDRSMSLNENQQKTDKQHETVTLDIDSSGEGERADKESIRDSRLNPIAVHFSDNTAQDKKTQTKLPRKTSQNVVLAAAMVEMKEKQLFRNKKNLWNRNTRQDFSEEIVHSNENGESDPKDCRDRENQHISDNMDN